MAGLALLRASGHFAVQRRILGLREQSGLLPAGPPAGRLRSRWLWHPPLRPALPAGRVRAGWDGVPPARPGGPGCPGHLPPARAARPSRGTALLLRQRAQGPPRRQRRARSCGRPGRPAGPVEGSIAHRGRAAPQDGGRGRGRLVPPRGQPDRVRRGQAPGPAFGGGGPRRPRLLTVSLRTGACSPGTCS